MNKGMKDFVDELKRDLLRVGGVLKDVAGNLNEDIGLETERMALLGGAATIFDVMDGLEMLDDPEVFKNFDAGDKPL